MSGLYILLSPDEHADAANERTSKCKNTCLEAGFRAANCNAAEQDVWNDKEYGGLSESPEK